MAVEETNKSGEGTAQGTGGSGGTRGGAKKNRNRIIMVAAGGAGLFLLFAHQGKGSSTAQNPSAQLAAEQAQIDAQLAQGAMVPQAVAPAAIDQGTGEADQTNGGSGVTTGGEDADPTEAAASDAAAAASSADAAAVSAATSEIASKSAQGGGSHKKPAGKKPAKSKKAPTKPHKNTAHRGATVHGRHFPGATGHNITHTQKVGQDVHQTVKVNYGGRTDVHISVNGGQAWIDHPKGHTPPSRGTPHAAHATHAPMTNDMVARVNRAPAPAHVPAKPAVRRAPARRGRR